MISSESDARLVQDLLTRCSALLDELSHLDAHTHSQSVNRELPGLDTYTSLVKREQKFAEELRFKEPHLDHSRYQHRSKLVYCETRWAAVKRCHGLLCMWALFSRDSKPGCARFEVGRAAMGGRGKHDKRSEKDVLVDFVVKNGAEWVKVVGLSEKKMLQQMADGGWDWEQESDGDNPRDEDATDWDQDGREGSSSDEDGHVKIMQTVRRLIDAARANRHDFKPPQIHLVLLGIQEGQVRDIDILLRKLRLLGGEDVPITVDCANSAFLSRPVHRIQDILSTLIRDEADHLTPTVNIDQDILTELASDIVNSDLTLKPWHVQHVREQIIRDGPGNPRPLQNMLAVLGARKLVCTEAAAKKFLRIVGSMGTEKEMARARLLLPREGDEPPRQREEVVADLQRLSIHPLPPDLQLPVEIARDDYGSRVEELVKCGHLPSIAVAVARALGERDRAIFLHGWATGCTTLTCNKAAVRKLMRVLDENCTGDGELGPRIWVSSNSGNLARRENTETGRQLGVGAEAT